MLGIDTETTGLHDRYGCRVFMFLSTDERGNTTELRFDVDPFTRDIINNKRFRDNKKQIRKIVTAHDTLVFHNAPFDIKMLSYIDDYFKPDNLWKRHEVHDTILIGHHYDSREKKGLKERALLHIDYPDDDEEELKVAAMEAAKLAAKYGWKVASSHNTPFMNGTYYAADYWVPYQIASHLNYTKGHPWYTVTGTYGIGDVIRTLGLFIFYQTALDAKQWAVYEQHRQCIPVFMRMQEHGVHVLYDNFENVEQELERTCNRYIKSMQNTLENPSFNPASPKQLAEAIYQHYKFEPTKFGKTGPSTAKDVLEELADNGNTDHDDPVEARQFISSVQKLRSAKKAKEAVHTYKRHAINELLHTTFNQVGTNTVRISSALPNVQNVGKKKNPFASQTEFKLRKLFGPKKGYRWYCGDYDQFQIRIFATAANDTYLLDAFANGMDCHHAVACKMYGVDTPTEMQRRAAKYVNFGIIFGAGPKRIEALSGMPGSYELFVQQFPKVFEFLDKCERHARRHGFVYTLGGYRLSVPSQRTYTGANYVVQGTEGEIVKLAMVEIDNYLQEVKSPLQMFLPVHDELVFDAPRRIDISKDLRKVQSIMIKHSERLGIPASVDFKYTETTWADVEPFTLSA